MRNKILSLFIGALFSVGSEPVVASEKHLVFSSIQGSPVQDVAQLILKQVYHKLDYTVSFLEVPAKRALMMSSNGETDGETIRVWQVGEAYPKLLRVPTAVFRLKGYAYSLKGSPINTVEQLTPNLRIGIQRGITWSEKIVANRKGVVRMDSAKDLAQKLLSGSIDVALYAGIGFEDEIQTYDRERLIVMGAPVFDQGVYHYLHEKHKELVDPVNTVLLEMDQAGELDTLYTSAMNN